MRCYDMVDEKFLFTSSNRKFPKIINRAIEMKRHCSAKNRNNKPSCWLPKPMASVSLYRDFSCCFYVTTSSATRGERRVLYLFVIIFVFFDQNDALYLSQLISESIGTKGLF